MKYVSLDLETSCVNDKCPENILMLSMVCEDTEKPEIPVEELPNFTVIIEQSVITGELTALAMNSWILVAIEYSRSNMKRDAFINKYHNLGIEPKTLDKAIAAAEKYKICGTTTVYQEANAWLDHHFGTKDKITVAGKNAAGFDLLFLPKDFRSRFRHSVIDPGTMFWNPEFDRMLPDSKKVMERAGVEYEGAHDALEDARMVIKAIRNSPYYLIQKMAELVGEVMMDDQTEMYNTAQEIYSKFPEYLKKGSKNESNR